MRFRFVARERASFPVRRLCRLVGVAASGVLLDGLLPRSSLSSTRTGS